MKSVLVLCTGNSCRSQMAEALFPMLSDGEWKSESAGSKPSGYVHPLAIKAMAEAHKASAVTIILVEEAPLFVVMVAATS